MSIYVGGINGKAQEVTTRQKRFDSGWFNIAASGVYNFNHNLNIPVENQRVRLLARVITASISWAVGDVIDASYANSAGGSSTELGSVFILTNNAVRISFGAGTSFIFNSKNGGNESLPKASVQCKVIVEYL